MSPLLSRFHTELAGGGAVEIVCTSQITETTKINARNPTANVGTNGNSKSLNIGEPFQESK
jgi:hypothetical protein